MRSRAVLLVLIACLMAAGGVHAMGNHGPHLQCDYDSDYDVQVQPNGIAFTRDSGHPADVFMHDGQLRVDGRAVTVSAQDVARLREYEQQMRELVPAMAAIARGGVDVGYAALATVVATMVDNGDQRTHLLQTLRDRRVEALQQVDETLGRGLWKAGVESELFNQDLEKTVSDLVGGITGDAVSDALSGDPNRLAALEARANALDATLDKAVETPAERLGQRAEALCPRLNALNQLQQQFQFRLADGGRLQLLSSDMDSSNQARQYAQR
ncbi:DUF2884 family protein [Dyella flava]|uniref:DUF2884 family protein n=1 Tax=Dyella flava TaxID=1920170 RepID=A0ABS2K6T8_9GAMM|nr:DUF2884 family protein [Dyella flava]MBM7126038.1 DUF2884 family protein [Dyella flava]GLQ49159.1 hypothetical protein GCM10010872_06080 [Dyella flava]